MNRVLLSAGRNGAFHMAVVEDFGTPLSGEAELLENDGDNIAVELANALGIKTRFAAHDLRIYIPLRDAESTLGGAERITPAPVVWPARN